MWEVVKKYWDIIAGFTFGLGLTFFSRFNLEKVQLSYSIIILILANIGVLRMVKQAVEKQKERKERKHNLIDDIVDNTIAVKAVRLAQNPTKDGEQIGKILIKTIEGVKVVMNKVKTFFDKFKGIILSIALGILTIVEMCGGYLNTLCAGKLTVNGIELIPLITLVASVVVGIISNGWTKEQKEKIKALFCKSTTDELVQAEIKKTLKEQEMKLRQCKSVLATKQTELDNLSSELVTKDNTLLAKVQMSGMTPKLATDEDVSIARIAVNEVKEKIEAKKKEITEMEKSIQTLNSTITALKSQL